MFWVPIMAIFLVIWYVRYLSDTVKTERFNKEYSQWRSSVDEFRRLTRDEDLEQKLGWDFEDYKIDCDAVICEFMGGDPKWAAYSGGKVYGKRKAEMVLMAQRGKFPGPVSSFSIGSVNPKSRFTNSQWTDMNVEFLTELTMTLRQKLGRYVVLYATYTVLENDKLVTRRRTLQECVRAGEEKYITWAASLEFAIE